MLRCLTVLALAFTTLLPAHAQLAIRADTIHTMTGDPIVDGVVLVSEGVIEAVGPASEVDVPSGYRTLEGVVLTPGLIDAHSVVGLAGIYNQDSDQDQLETSDPLQPELRAIDAYNAREELVQFLNGKGITTVHTGHGPGALASGQTMIVRTAGSTVSEAVVDDAKMLAMTIGESVESRFDAPGTRSKGVAMLRKALIDAQQYDQKMSDDDAENDPKRDLKMEALARVVSGGQPVLVTAQRVPDIMAALRLAEEFDLDLVLDGATESYLVIDELADAGVPVILHPTMVRPAYETQNASFTTAAKLHRAGIPFAFQSGYEGYVPKTRVVLYEAAIAAANGLPRDAALRALTADAADMLGLGDEVGTIEPGKRADLALFEGDPLEYVTRVCAVVTGGELTHEGCR